MTEEQRNEVRLDPAAERLPEIYGFVNGGSPGWYNVVALSEDGEFLAGHACSHPGWGPHDIGVTSDWKHDGYRERYPHGFVVIWVEDCKTDPRIKAAHAKHVAYGAEGSPWQRERAKARAESEAP